MNQVSKFPTKSDILISFIIPAHNAEATIEGCVRSITDYKGSDIEVIIVENASDDNTIDAVKRLMVTDSRIRLYKSDIGVSNARNYGIEQSVGKWIVFVDADDYINTGGMNTLIKTAGKSTSDMILYGHRIKDRTLPVCNKSEGETYKGSDVEAARIRMIKNPTRYMQVWAKLLRADVIRDNNVRFNTRIALSEDSDFTIRLSKHCHSIEFSPENLYCYTLNSSSTMRSYDGSKHKEYIKAMQITEKALEQETEAVRQSFNYYIVIHLNILLVRDIYCNQNTEDFRHKYHKMERIKRLPVFHNAITNIKISECTSFRMLPILFLKMKMDMLAALVYMVRAKMNFYNENKL